MKACILYVAIAGLLVFSACGLRSRSTLDPEVEQIEAVNQQIENLAPMNLWTGLEQGDSTALAMARYTIQEEDVLTVYFPNAESQNFNARVRPDGRITLPAVGELLVLGQEPMAVAESITQEYASVLREPRAVVSIESFAPRSFYVFGEVRRPNKYTYESGLSLMNALTTAGGVERSASLSNIVVLRVSPEDTYTYSIFDLNDLLSQSQPNPVWLQPRDIVVVPTSTIADIGIWIDQYINTFLPPIDAFLRGRYYWKLVDDVTNN